MHYQKACDILDILPGEICMNEIKKQYRSKALLYHPDKNPDANACAKFQEIQEAYHYLLKTDDDEDTLEYDSDDPDNETLPKTGYRWMLFSFLKNVLTQDQPLHLFQTILKNVAMSCETKALDTLVKLDKSLLLKTRDILKKYKGEMHIAESFLEKIDALLLDRMKNDECIIVNPMLSDLFEHHLYKLRVGDFTYVVPLWHHELVYDNSGNDIYVKCNPILPENMTLDEKNNLHVRVKYSILDIWEKDTVDISICGKVFVIDVRRLRLSGYQTIVFSQEGISRIQSTNIYDISIRADVIIEIELDIRKNI